MTSNPTDADEAVFVSAAPMPTPAEDDDDDEDSDYDPTKDPSALEDDQDNDAESFRDKGLGTELTGSRKRKVDEAWLEMNEEDDRFVRGVVSSSLWATKPGKKKTKRRRKALQVLSDVFGASNAKRMLGLRSRKRADQSNAKVSGDVVDAARNAVRNVKSEKVQITQSVKFAGQMTTVTKTVDAHSKEAQAAQLPPVKKSGLESVLDEIKGPKTITTLEKTSVDWDGYKEENNLADDLERKTKEGYLDRQDFLNRCDVRKFEQEKAERNVQRTKQLASAARKS